MATSIQFVENGFCHQYWIILLCMSLCGSTARGEDFSDLLNPERWSAKYPAKVTIENLPEAMGDNSGMRLVFGPQEKQKAYAEIQCKFKKPVNMSGLRALSFFARSKTPLNVFAKLYCRGGKLKWQCRQSTTAAYSLYKLPRARAAIFGAPDLTRVTGFMIGLVLRDFKKQKNGFTVELVNLEYDGTEHAYIIPKPKRGVAIDGQYKDWGYEDVLYNWYPPDYIYLNASRQVAAGKTKWSGRSQLSGRFAMMMDERNLYILGLVVDATPFQGDKAEMPWENDSVEVFLALKPTYATLRHGESMKKNGAQIVFDCGADSSQTRLFLRGKRVEAAIKRKTIPHAWAVCGEQARGYVLEAAVPLVALGIERPTGGALLGYSIKLNDSSGIHLIATPDNLAPHADIENFRKAYVDFVSKEQREIEFGPVAANVFWPKYFTKGKGRIRIWDSKCDYRRKMSATVERQYLHSLWAAQPCADDSSGPNPGNWRYTALPMGFSGASPSFFPHPGKKDELGAEGQGSVVMEKFRLKRMFFWCERTFVPAAEFRGGKLFLVFEYVTEEAKVYLNGQYLGMIDVAQTRLDITNHIRHGRRNRLDVFLHDPSKHYYSIRNGMGGITGDVYLEHHRKRPVIKNIWVKVASGLDGSFEIIVETVSAPKKAKLAVDILDNDGKVVARAKGTVTGSTVSLQGRCAGFLPWSPDHPDLFRARVRYEEGDTLVDERFQRFGFRTFEFKNARFLLNGKFLRFRSTHASRTGGVLEPGYFRELKRRGHNFIFMHASFYGYNEPLFDRLDEEGLLTMAPVDRSASAAKAARMIREHRNHPSVLMYISDQFGQLNMNGFSHNPFSVSDTYYPDSSKALKKYEFLRKRYEFFRSIDPTRPYFPQATGNFEGAPRTTHHYPTYDLNLLDQMMFFAHWSERSNPLSPLFLIEAGCNNLVGLDGPHPEHQYPVDEDAHLAKRLILNESASRYIGSRAFDDWREWDAMIMRMGIRGLRVCGIDGFSPWIDSPWLDVVNSDKPLGFEDNRKRSYRYFILPFKDVLDDICMRFNSVYYRRRGFACRQWPERYGQKKITPKRNPYTPIYENEMQPFFACIMGPSGNQFSLAHSYFSSERISKQIVVVNDTQSDANIRFDVMFEVNGNNMRRAFNLKIPQGGIVKQAFRFYAPRVAVKTSALLRLCYSNPEGEAKEDVFNITVFPGQSADSTGFFFADGNRHPWKKPDWKARIGVIPGPQGDSLLAKAGVPFETVSLKKALPEGLDLLVIERNALTKSVRGEFLKQFIDSGGQVLMLEQSEAGLLDWRLRERRLEHAFIADRKHPVIAGLDDKDLAFFRGAATIVPVEKRPSRFYRNYQSTALETPHLTNVGLVASYVFQKPCYGDFRPIIVAGYDLEEAALIEMRSGKGRLLSCQMDVTDRYGRDPAATLLVDNMLCYMLASRPLPRTPKVTYVGGGKGKAFLDRLGVRYALTAEQASPVLVIGDGDIRLDLKTIAGSKEVVVLPFSRYVPSGLKTDVGRIRTLCHPYNSGGYEKLKILRPSADRLGESVSEVFRGLVDNDAYFFEDLPLKSFFAVDGGGFTIEWHSKYSTMVQGRVGTTRVVLCSVDPYLYQYGECRRKAWRIWSMVFSNLGVANSHSLKWTPPALDISEGEWFFLTDPAGQGDKIGFQHGHFGGRVPRSIQTGIIWEKQGVIEANPNMEAVPDSGYDGIGWYLRKVTIPSRLRGKVIYLHVDGIRDITTYSRTSQRSDLWINGTKMDIPVGIYNAKQGGRAGRLWIIKPESIRFDEENLIAIRIFNNIGPGGIHRRPVRFEIEGQNQEMLFPYEFIRSKFNPYYFWSW